MDKIIIVAAASNNVIGKNGSIPWHSKEELKHFKNTTYGFPILMGRKTFESLGKPLKGRLNIIITRNKQYKTDFDDVLIFNNLNDAYRFCEKDNYEKIFIIGGGEIYTKAIEDADIILLTRMNVAVDGDTYFPELDDNWLLKDNVKFEEFTVYTYINNRRLK